MCGLPCGLLHACVLLQLGEPLLREALLPRHHAPQLNSPPSPRHHLPVVPCMRRAAAVFEYGAREEQEVEADDGGEGWVTASQARPEGPPTTTNADGFEEIPSVGDDGKDGGGAGGGGSGGAADAGAASGSGEAGEEDNEDVPDIADLELEDEEEDEVGGGCDSGAGGVYIMCREGGSCCNLEWCGGAASCPQCPALVCPAWRPPTCRQPPTPPHTVSPPPTGGGAAGQRRCGPGRRCRAGSRGGCHPAHSHLRSAHYLRQTLRGMSAVREYGKDGCGRRKRLLRGRKQENASAAALTVFHL